MRKAAPLGAAVRRANCASSPESQANPVLSGWVKYYLPIADEGVTSGTRSLCPPLHRQHETGECSDVYRPWRTADSDPGSLASRSHLGRPGKSCVKQEAQRVPRVERLFDPRHLA